MLSLNLASRTESAGLAARRSSVILLACLLMACGVVGIDETPSYRYRLTIEVETPEGLRSGSSVIQVGTSVASRQSIPTPGKVSHRVRGEAVAVDLPNDRTLFALLQSSHDSGWASRVMFMLAPDGPPDAKDRFLARHANLLKMRGKIELPETWPPGGGLSRRSAYPLLVTFGDVADPTSVYQVDPGELETVFGSGVSLRRITVELTEAEVSTGITQRLPWLYDIWPNRLNGERFQDLRKPEMAARLSANSFSTEIGK